MDCIIQIAENLGVLVDDIFFDKENGGSNMVYMEDKVAFEKVNLSKQLDDDDCTVVFMIIDTMLQKDV